MSIGQGLILIIGSCIIIPIIIGSIIEEMNLRFYKKLKNKCLKNIRIRKDKEEEIKFKKELRLYLKGVI